MYISVQLDLRNNCIFRSAIFWKVGGGEARRVGGEKAKERNVPTINSDF